MPESSATGRSPTSGEYVRYRVVETMLARHKPSGEERVCITAMDEAADLLTWSAQPDRVPPLGTVIEVSMRRYEDDPPPDDHSCGPDGGSDA